MKIHENFTGGNITVEKREGSVFYLKNQLRDTTCDWFYWAFCIEGAQGRTLTFRFSKDRIGYFGPAVSHDLKNWHWLMTKKGDNKTGSARGLYAMERSLTEKDGDSFTYTFSETEEKVYFAHHLLYHPERFYRFTDKNGLQVRCLCKSQKGRVVPYVEMGTGEKKIVLTARHHACESTGNYVLEGVLEELCHTSIRGFSVLCVPFVDYDGVMDGDQGKNRFPHDHNRDYDEKEAPVYPSTAAIRKYVSENQVAFGFDFHSPWHCGGIRDKCFIVQKRKEDLPGLNRFGELLEASMTARAFGYTHADDYPPDYGWNHASVPTFAAWVLAQPSAKLAFTLETAYFGREDRPFTPEGAIENGRCFVRALIQYVNFLDTLQSEIPRF